MDKMNKTIDEKFFEEIEYRNDNLYLILRGHLYLEAELLKLLETNIPNHKILELSKMTFYNKVILVTALNIIDEKSMEALLELNTIRNKYAHNLNYKIKKEEIRKLKGIISKINGLEYLENEFVLNGKEGDTVHLKVCLVGLRTLLKTLYEPIK